MATRSLNKVQLIGNLTRDPELRYTPQGNAVCTVGLATNRQWVTDAGEKREEAEFHRIVAWNKLAELCSQLLFKGRKVYVEGRLQTRQWTAQDGTPRQTTEIVIDEMMVLDSRRQPEEAAEAVPEEPTTLKEEVPVEETAVAAQEATPATIKEAVPAAPTITAPSGQKKPTKKATKAKKEIEPDDIPF